MKILKYSLSFSIIVLIIICVIACKIDISQNDQIKLKSEAVVTKNFEFNLVYVSRDSCRDCHTREYDLWQGSDHDQAMQIANAQTVLGDFKDITYTHYGITSKFYQRDGKFYVYTEGSQGTSAEYEIKYTFGIRPLQQYLVEFPGGRYQVLPLCWDSRPREQGGQKWFHIYPNERISPSDVLYWTKVLQNWNYMCSECHSTNVKKRYDFKSNIYQTTFSEVDVSCEACHGPGSEHISWAKEVEKGAKIKSDSKKGLLLSLKDRDAGTWVFDIETGSARRTTPRKSHKQIEICWRCHSRRTVINENYIHGNPFMDTHIPSLLIEDLYYADGQIEDEVYVYGSFLQSKMYDKGVVCHDCHEPHSMKVYASGNPLCYRCHLQEKFGQRAHHFHNPDSTGAICVECHMPERSYMVIDPRRDHSIRIPRPDLSEKLKTPNACNRCHKDKDMRWSVTYVRKWYGDDFVEKSHFGEILYAGRNQDRGAVRDLIQLATDTTQASIVSATALWLLRDYPSPKVAHILQDALNRNDALHRYAALYALEILAPNERVALAKHLLKDPVRTIRIQAARSLSEVSAGALSPSRRKEWQQAIEEYIAAQQINADHPSAHLNLGTLYLAMKQYEKAEEAYQTAIKIVPTFVLAYINLADLYRILNREDEGEQILRRALRVNPNSANTYYTLGLLKVRQKSTSEALNYLKLAKELDPDDPNLSYAYAIALNSAGNTDSALVVLQEAYKQNPYDQQILFTLATIYRDLKIYDSAIKYVHELLVLAPQNPTYNQLLQQLLVQQPK